MEWNYRIVCAYLYIKEETHHLQDAMRCIDLMEFNIQHAYIYREAINKIMDNHYMKLRDYELKDHEWKIVEELQDCLKVCLFFFTWLCFNIYLYFLQMFRTITLEFSSDTPCIGNAIPAMDRMHTELDTACKNENCLLQSVLPSMLEWIYSTSTIQSWTTLKFTRSLWIRQIYFLLLSVY